MKPYFITYPDSKKFQTIRYPAGELQIRLLESEADKIAESDEIVVTAYITNGDIVGLALLTDAIQEATDGWPKMTLVLPYLPYSRADRRFTKGDCYGLKVFGKLIDALGYDKVITVDAHSSKAKKLISNLEVINPVEIMEMVRYQIDNLEWHPDRKGKIVTLFPDEGAAKRYPKIKALFCEKERDPKTGKLSGFKIPPKEAFDGVKGILIVDDICDGGGTFVGIAEELHKCGVNIPLFLYVTHGIFSKGFGELNQYFSHVYTTDSFKSLTTVGAKLLTRVLLSGIIRKYLFFTAGVYANATNV